MAKSPEQSGEAREAGVKAQPSSAEATGGKPAKVGNQPKVEQAPGVAQKQGKKGKGKQQPAGQQPAPATPEKKDEKPAGSNQEAKPATPLPPPPPPPLGIRDSDPFHRNVVDTQIHKETVPLQPSANLEREANRSRNEDINDLIESIRNIEANGKSQWENAQREDRLRERYGKPSVMRDMKAWISGENDLVYNKDKGTVEYRYGTEVFRRLASVGVNTAETAGIMAVLGLVTGGGALVVAPALIGSTLGRGFAEAWQGISGEERGMREDLVIARERYYQKAAELANRIPPTEPSNWEGMDVRERSEYTAQRNAAVRSLVNFVHASEQNGVKLIHRGRERKSLSDIWQNRNKAGGQPFVESEVFGQPVEVGDRSKGEPVGPTGAGGPSLNRGSEVYQPSKDAPSKDTLDDMEKEFAKFRRKWDLIKAGVAMVGGLAGSAEAILATKKEAVVQLTQKLDAGKVVKLDIDGNFIWHNVQKMTEGFRSAWGLQDQFVFHYKNTIESLKAAAHGVQMLPGGDFGAHALNATALRIAQAVDKQAWLEALRYTGIPAIGAIAAQFGWRKGTTEKAHRNFEQERDQMKQEEEILRRRRQPENRIEQLRNDAHKEGKVFPSEGQIWRYVIDAGEPGNPDKKALWGYLQIVKVIDTPDNVYLQIIRKDPRDPDDTVEEISADELIYGGYKQIITNKDELRTSAMRVGDEGQSAPEINTRGGIGSVSSRQVGEALGGEPDQLVSDDADGDEEVVPTEKLPVEKVEEKPEKVILEVGKTYDATLRSPAEKNSADVEINGTKFHLVFKSDINSARFPRGGDIDFKVLGEPRQIGKNPPIVEAELGPKAKAREVNPDYDPDILENALTGKDDEKKEKPVEDIKVAIEKSLEVGSQWKVADSERSEIIGVDPSKPGERITVKLSPELTYNLDGLGVDGGEWKVSVSGKDSTGSDFVLVCRMNEFLNKLSPEAISNLKSLSAKKNARSGLIDFANGFMEENRSNPEFQLSKTIEPASELGPAPAAEPEPAGEAGIDMTPYEIQIEGGDTAEIKPGSELILKQEGLGEFRDKVVGRDRELEVEDPSSIYLVCEGEEYPVGFPKDQIKQWVENGDLTIN